MKSETLHNLIDFNIDRYLNPYIPRNHLDRLPKPISHFFGFRHEPHKEPAHLPQLVLAVLSTTAGLLLVGAVYNYASDIVAWHPPTLIASLGASAILEYNAVRSPLAQPRNAILGHVLSAIVAVGIAKLFMYQPEFFAQYMWVVACIACAAASLVMSLTNSLHPPGGAAAILACTDTQIIAMGWKFPALLLVGTMLMLAVAFLFNNTLRQYPTHWWTAEETGSKLYRKKPGEEEAEEERKQSSASDLESGGSQTDYAKKMNESDGTDSERTLAHDSPLTRPRSHDIEVVPGSEAIQIEAYEIKLPEHMQLSEEDRECLQKLMQRLRSRMEGEPGWQSSAI